MKNVSFIVGAICLAFVLWIAMDPPMATATVEDASWGAVKSEQQTYRAGKAAHHARATEINVDAESLVGEWTSRRWNDENQLEDVVYVFNADRTVTLAQTLVDGPADAGLIPPLNGKWEWFADQQLLQITWAGGEVSNWSTVRLFEDKDKDPPQNILDYRNSPDKEERTLDRTSPLAPPRNWRIELTPNVSTIIGIPEGTWKGFDFEVFAADRHPPDFLNFHVEVSSGTGMIHILDKRAYSGSDEVPGVNVCFDSFKLPGWTRTPWPRDLDLLGNSSVISSQLLDAWISDGEFSMDLKVGATATGGFYITGCGKRAVGTVEIFSPESRDPHSGDLPLTRFRVEIQ